MIKYGSHVAFLLNGNIRFGIIAAIVQRTDGNGETTEHVVSSNSLSDGQPKPECDIVISDEDDIADLESWSKDRALLTLAMRSPLWKKSKEQSDAILNSPDSAPAEATPAPLVTDGTPTKPEEIF